MMLSETDTKNIMMIGSTFQIDEIVPYISMMRERTESMLSGFKS